MKQGRTNGRTKHQKNSTWTKSCDRIFLANSLGHSYVAFITFRFPRENFAGLPLLPDVLHLHIFPSCESPPDVVFSLLRQEGFLSSLRYWGAVHEKNGTFLSADQSRGLFKARSRLRTKSCALVTMLTAVTVPRSDSLLTANSCTSTVYMYTGRTTPSNSL